ncbi:MAG TPA: hypothetical protein VNT51_01780 [Miltoncostaeaceae bacterium]|nr:hypothetical protein [Miltoncostaeaceae bacterium]
MGHRLLPLLAVLAALLLAGCGPTGPAEQGGRPAEPVALLRVLPVPLGLRDAQPATEVDPPALLQAMTGSGDPALAARLREAGGLRQAGVRSFAAPGGGRLVASVAVWPARLIAANLALTVAQQRLGDPGVRAWTPQELPATQGVREEGGDRERVLARSVGPNTIVIRATGDVPDDAVVRTMQRLVTVQEVRGG